MNNQHIKNLILKILNEELKSNNVSIINEIGLAGENEPDYSNRGSNVPTRITDDIKKLAMVLYKSRSSIWSAGYTKGVLNNFNDMIWLAITILNWVKKNQSYNIGILKASISLLFRESKASPIHHYSVKEVLGMVGNLFGGNHSQGYAQIQPKIAKKYGISLASLYTYEGSLDAAYRTLTEYYNKAKKYYSGPSVSFYDKSKKLVQTPAINNDAALHMACASHNGGTGILGKWCMTNIVGIANKCDEQSRKPWDDSRIAITKKDKPINNYLPNKGTPGTLFYMKHFTIAFNNLKNLDYYIKKAS